MGRQQEERELFERYGQQGERLRADYPVATLHHARLWELVGGAGRCRTRTVTRITWNCLPNVLLTEIRYLAFKITKVSFAVPGISRLNSK